MSRYCGETETAPILEAAKYWKERALEQDDAVFSDDVVWQAGNVEALVDRYVSSLDLGPGHYLDKLETQLRPVSPAGKQLAAEMQWVMLLCPSNISAANKRDVFGRVWSWAGGPSVTSSRWFTDEVLAGIGSAGTSFNTNRWRELAFFVRLIQSFKRLSSGDRKRLLSDGWSFAEFMESVPECESRQLRHMLLFLLWPDDFERIFGGNDRRAIVAAFTGKAHAQVDQLSALQIDRELAAIRKAQEEKLNTRELDFYTHPLDAEWTRVPIPRTITRDHVLLAIHEAEREGWPDHASSTTYDLIFEGRRFPPKYILALAGKHATGEELDRNSFSGGEDSTAFSVLRKLGFEIERKDFVPELIRRFIAQANGPVDLSTSGYPKTYCGLDVNVSFGKGNLARVPWISFTGFDQTTSNGIYPVFLYYKAAAALVLAYGISETNAPLVEWENAEDIPTVSAYLNEQFKVDPERYGSSKVFSAYKKADGLRYEDINGALDALIAKYQKQLGQVTKPTEGVWIFQANPSLYDIDGALAKLPTITWTVRQHKDQIKKGDTVYIWRSGKEAGIVAIAKIADDAKQLEPPLEEQEFIRGLAEIGELRVPCSMTKVLEEPLLRDVLNNDPILRSLSILRFGQGTNFAVTVDQARALAALLGPERHVELQPKYSLDEFVAETGFSISRIEQWRALLLRKKQIVFQGPPGTGKTFVAERLARHLISETNGEMEVVQFHPSYAYEDFIQGIRPEIVEGRLSFKLAPGRFLEFCATATKRGPDAPCVLIIDELNRANLSRVFGELMYLLEYRDKEAPLASGGKRLRVPRNVYLIGTMNTADRSIALVDHALRRRFSFVFLGPEYEILAQQLGRYQLPAESLVKTLQRINSAINDKNYEVGISFFLADGPNLRATLPAIWTAEIEPYLEEFFYDQLDKIDGFRWSRLRETTLVEWA